MNRQRSARVNFCLASSLILTLSSTKDLRAQEWPSVFLGRIDCESNQMVTVQEIRQTPGQYLLQFKKFKYTMIHTSTTTGVVRLEDPISGATWVQLSSKSMLMDSRRGVRLVDECQHPTQKAMAAAMKAAPSQPLIEVDTSTK